MRIILNAGESLTAVLGGAVATTNPQCLIEWRDGGHVATTSVALNGDTAVTLLDSPRGGRGVEGVRVLNLDTASVTLTLSRVAADGTSWTVASLTLGAGYLLEMTPAGLRVLDSTGQLATGESTTLTEAHPVLPGAWRVHDAVASNLPATAGTDDLGLVLGTDGTDFVSLQSIDFKATTTTAYARALVALPPDYVEGSAVTIRVRAGMLTTVADTAATVDVEAYSNDGDATGSADLCETDAQSCNSLTFANLDFTLDPTGLVAGQLLNLRLTVAGEDAETGTAVIAAISNVEIRTTVRR